MPKCKHCGKMLGLMNKRKSWILKSTLHGKETKTRIDLYDCPNCGKTTRIGTRI